MLPDSGAHSASLTPSSSDRVERLLDVLFDALPDIENALVCIKWQERCSRDSTVTVGDVDEFAAVAVNLVDELEDLVDTLDPRLERAIMLIERLLHGDVDNRLVCVKVSEPCSGNSTLVVGDIDELLPPP
jgi:hypothetical protein